MTDDNLTKVLHIIPTLAATISFVALSLAFVHEWAFYFTKFVERPELNPRDAILPVLMARLRHADRL